MMYDAPQPEAQSRLNLLLSYAGWQHHNWAEQLPRLLQPMGIAAFRVGSGQEAARLIALRRVHIAVVDLGLPLEESSAGKPADSTGGTRLLQILRRLDSPPPTVVVRRPSDRAAANQRTLTEALNEGAFAVVDAPVHLEVMLETMRRILRRYYADRWPDTGSAARNDSQHS